MAHHDGMKITSLTSAGNGWVYALTECGHVFASEDGGPLRPVCVDCSCNADDTPCDDDDDCDDHDHDDGDDDDTGT